MRYFSLYIRQRRMEMLLFAAVFILFALSFFLYRLPLKAVIYPYVLATLLCAFWLLTDYFKLRKKYCHLYDLSKGNPTSSDIMPKKATVEDVGYQIIISSLLRQIDSLTSASDARYRETIDYYTMWAHQIKTPIASMKLSINSFDNEMSHNLSCELSRIEQYVDMVMAYLRLDSEYSDYVFKRCDIDPIIKRSVRRFSREFIMRKIGLKYETIRISTVTDEKWLGFVIEQLISNALKYTKTGSIRIYQESPYVLSIQDSGIGISSHDLPRIFDKGYTGYNGRDNEKSSGLGLYLCKTICQRLGVRINATSELGVGTTISLDFSQYDLKTE